MNMGPEFVLILVALPLLVVLAYPLYEAPKPKPRPYDWEVDGL